MSASVLAFLLALSSVPGAASDTPATAGQDARKGLLPLNATASGMAAARQVCGGMPSTPVGLPAQIQGSPTKASLKPFAESDANTISRETSKPSWRDMLAIDVDPRTSVTGKLTVTIEPLQSANGEAAAVLCVLKDGAAARSHTFDVASWPMAVMLGADGLARGTQLAIVRFATEGGGELVRALKITRKPAPYTVGAAQKVVGNSWTDVLPVHVIGLPILAPAEHALSLRVHPFQFRRLVGADPPIDVILDRVRLIDGGRETAATEALTFEAGTSRPLQVRLEGYLDAGRYQAEFRIVSPDHDDKTHVVEIAVRRYWAWVLLPIWLGAAVSVRLRRLASQDRPRLMVQRAVSEVQELATSLRASDLQNVELAVIDTIEERVASVGRQSLASDPLAPDWAATAHKQVDEEERKLRVFATWTNARRVLDHLPKEETDAQRKELSELGALLIDATALEASAPNRAHKLLAKAREMLDDPRRVRPEGAPGFDTAVAHVVARPEKVFDRAATEARLARVNLTIDTATFLVTGLLGVLVLWNADPTWGDLSDFIAAFFWGLGLGQVSATTFTGISSFTTKLTT